MTIICDEKKLVKKFLDLNNFINVEILINLTLILYFLFGFIRKVNLILLNTKQHNDNKNNNNITYK